MVKNSVKSNEKMFNLFIRDAENNFSGWDFSYINNRCSQEPLPWAYASVVLPYLKSSSSSLDMGTGGGEILLTFQPFPAKMVATEMYDKNYPIAKANLEPLGVSVVTYNDKNALPFEDKQFDLIINRHEYYPPDDLYRILNDDGIFITQQVGELDCNNLIEFLGATGYQEEGTPEEWNLTSATKQLTESSFSIIKSNESVIKTRYYDIGALAYFLTVVPFVVENFTVKKYEDKLKEIFNQIEQKGFYEVNTHRFFLIAQKY